MSDVDRFHAELRRRGPGARAWADGRTLIEYLGGGRFAASIEAARRRGLLIAGDTAALDNPAEDGYIWYRPDLSPYYGRYSGSSVIQAGKEVPDYTYYSRAYVEWDISSLPSNAMVTLAKFRYHGCSHGVDCHIHEMLGVRPSTGGDQAVYDEAGEGTVYADPAGFPVAGAGQEVTLSPDAHADIEAQLDDGWFAVGIQSDDEGTTARSQIYAEEYGSVNPAPTLYVEYTPIDPPAVQTDDADRTCRWDDEGRGRLNGQITATGGEDADERGFEWDTDPGPPYANSWTETGSFGAEAFSRFLTGLPTGVTIYYRAKAHNPHGGWGYGAEKSFTISSPYTPPGFSGSTLSLEAMVWDPDAVGCRDDSFLGGGWDPYGVDVDVDHIDGDHLRLIVQPGETQGYIEKTGITVDASAHPYLVLGLWGDGGWFLQVYDGAWKTAQPVADAPDTYGFAVIDLSGVTTGTVTGIRLGVGSAAGKQATYDFFEFVSRPPWFPDDLISLRVLQREGEADVFEMETVMNGVVGDDCVLLMHMDEGLGDKAFDESMYGNDGAISGASWVDGRYGKALSFDGVDDQVQVPNHASLNPSQIAVEAWVKHDVSGVQDYIASKEDVFAIQVLSTNKLRFSVWNSEGMKDCEDDNAFDFTDGLHHVAGTYDGSKLKIYIDGDLRKQQSVTGGEIAGGSGILSVGSQWNIDLWWDGVIDEVRIYSRALTAAEIKRHYQRGPPSRVYEPGRCIRIAAGRGSNVEKVFAGVIEESTPGHGLRAVSGRCFQVKLQAAAKTKSLDDRELSLAVKDVVEDFDEVTTGRVETPSPEITVSKAYVDAHIADILDQLAGIPSKQAPYETWRWKLGYGQDLRFRGEDDGPTCSTSIEEGVNLLAGVRKGSDIYELYNRVKALSGLIEWPLDDGWCEDASGWSTYQCTVADETGAGKIRRGTKSIKVTYAGAGPPYEWRVYRTFTAKDLSEYHRLVFDLYLGSGWRDAVNALDVYCYSQGGGYFRYTVDDSNNVRDDRVWHHFEIDLDDPNWQESGSPSWTDIDEIRIVCVTGSGWTGDYWLDGLRFEADNLERTASDASSPADHDRVYVYKDAKIDDPDRLQDLADGLLRMMKAAADRVMLPVVGAPDLQRGRKVVVDAPSFGLSGAYVIAEAEHVIGRDAGYVTTVLLDRGRYALPADLRRTLERELRLERLGTVVIR